MLTADLLILIVFLLLNIIVGFRYRGKRQSFREYAVGDKQFSTATLTATNVATWMSGSTLFLCLRDTYSRGLYLVIAMIVGGSIGLLLMGRVVAPRLGKFANNISAPQSLGKLYGSMVQVIAGIASIFMGMGYIALQFQIIAKVLAILFNYESPVIVVVVATIVTLYTLFGGVKAVTFTDVIQFFTFGTLLPVLALTIWNHIQEHEQITQVLSTNPYFSLQKVFKWSPESTEMLAFTFYVMINPLAPEFFQRMLMARDAAQAKQSMTYATLIFQAINLCIMGIAILVLVDQPGLASDQIVNHVFNMHTHPGLKGLLCIGVIAMAMSTADSTINATAAIIANDVFLVPEKLQRNALRTAQYATLFLGGCSILVALCVQGLLKFLFLSACFYSPIVTVPIMLAILGFETSKRVVLMAMSAGAVVTTSCLLFFKSVNSFFPGMLANLITMLGLHYLLAEKGGWGNNPVTRNIEYLERKSWIRSLKIFDLPTYLSRALPVKTHFYSFLGFYIFTATYTSFFLLPKVTTLQCPLLYGIMQYSVLILSTTFLAFPIWPEKLKKKHFMTWIWPLSIFYTCFVVGSILVVLSGFSIPHMLIFMLNLVMAALLLHWPIAVIMASMGLLIALFVFKSYSNLIYPSDALNTLKFKIAYIMLLCSSFFLALFKHKQSYQDAQESNFLLRTTQKETNKALLEALKHREKLGKIMRDESMSMFTSVQEMSAKLQQETQNLKDEQAIITARATLKEANTKLKAAAVYFDQIIYRVKDHMRLCVNTISLEKLLQGALQNLKYKRDPDSKVQAIIQRYTQQKEVQCDVETIQQLLVNGIHYAQERVQDKQPIFLSISDTTLGYPITAVEGYIKKLEALCITIASHDTRPIPLDLYMGAVTNTGLNLSKLTNALSLLRNQRIVEEHYGTAELVEDAQGGMQHYIIPLRLREVRPTTMDLASIALDASVVSSNTNIYGQELDILETLKLYPKVDIEMVKEAIQLMKRCHAGVQRKSGEPFYLHPIAVAQILLHYTQDQDTIIAALLHDTVEDTPLALAQIEGLFNEAVQYIVDGVTHLESNIKTQKRVALSAHENIQKLLGVDDDRVLYVKLADRLHNMRTIEGHSSIEKQQKIAEETLQFFVPIARYLKLHAIEKELQQRSSSVLSRVR